MLVFLVQKFFFLSIYLSLEVLSLRGCVGLAVVSRGFSLQWLLLLLSREGLYGAQASEVLAPRPYSTGSVLLRLGLAGSMVCGVFQGQGLNLHRLHCLADSLPLSHQGSLE